MNTSGEAADQVVRMSMEAGEAALKITGAGAKQLAVLLYAVLKEQKKTRGRARLETLVRSGKPLTVFSVKESDMKKFVQEAKRYGILYSAIRPKGKGDGTVDIMVKEEDAPRINRIVERFKFASVTETAKVKTEIERAKEEKSQKRKGGTSKGKSEEKEAVSEEQQKDGNKETAETPKSAEAEKADHLVDELLGLSEKEPEKEKNAETAPKEPAALKKEEPEKEKSFFGRTRKSRPSGHISEKQERTGGDTSDLFGAKEEERPSVREELKQIQKKREETKKKEPVRETKQRTQKPLQHKQPQRKRKRPKAR